MFTLAGILLIACGVFIWQFYEQFQYSRWSRSLLLALGSLFFGFAGVGVFAVADGYEAKFYSEVFRDKGGPGYSAGPSFPPGWRCMEVPYGAVCFKKAAPEP